ncbi:DUF5610 domain-containing protein [Undibacterium sp. FT79W]|jgi:hypothetical protein|uniref:DUF5610 domain-containing protein n=1 Tax=Undibacterium sp. FT79W TaxID=2762296 RepID=UPI0021052885|nr:DUF5610 domain-containing protein [Undibacterium sp. FT79W]
MDLSVSGVNTSTPTVSAKPSTTVKRADSNGENASNAVASDKVSLDSSSAAKDSPVYADPRTKTSSSSDVAAAVEEANRKAQQITDLIKSAVQQQGLQLSKVVSGEQKITASADDIKAAQAAIADGGEFSAQKTAERILTFAKAAIGGDPAKLQKIRDAVEKGFKEAADILGGSLPDISQQTLKAVRAEFDRWQSQGLPTGDTVSLSSPAQASSDIKK